MAIKVLISLPKEFLEDVDRLAAKERRTRSGLIREALRAYARAQTGKKVGEAPARYTVKKTGSKRREAYPTIEMVKFTGGSSAVIRGTRVPVHVLIGYLQMGETPEKIARVIPHITVPQVYGAIHYYLNHRAEIDREREEHASWRALSAEFAAWELASDEALLKFEKGLK
jgi:uncharacterized protein (DUF433 family)